MNKRFPTPPLDPAALRRVRETSVLWDGVIWKRNAAFLPFPSYVGNDLSNLLQHPPRGNHVDHAVVWRAYASSHTLLAQRSPTRSRQHSGTICGQVHRSLARVQGVAMEVQGGPSRLASKVQLVHHSHRAKARQLCGPAGCRVNLWLPYRVQEGEDCGFTNMCSQQSAGAVTNADGEWGSQSDMVKAMAPVYKGKKQPTMFSAADNKTHARIRKPVAGAYAMTNIIQVRRLGRPPHRSYLRSEKIELLCRLLDSLASRLKWSSRSFVAQNRPPNRLLVYCPLTAHSRYGSMLTSSFNSLSLLWTKTRNCFMPRCKSFSSSPRSHAISTIGCSTVSQSILISPQFFAPVILKLNSSRIRRRLRDDHESLIGLLESGRRC